MPIQASGNQASAPDQAAATAERIIVTGSYIPTAETESALPVTVYTAETITKLGAQTPAEGLRQLPSFVGNTLTENDSNAGDGTALINLRALGAGNTLTLINGRRAFGFVDINLIGLGSLSRTEILKDGASSIYGSDAVAGVVNFILLNGPNEAPYEGAEVYGLYGNTTDTDAHVWQFYLRGGVTGLDGKFSVAAAGEYYSRANLFSRDRTIATTGDLSNDATGLQLGGFNNNSPTLSGRVAVDGAQLILIDQTNTAPTLASYRPFDAAGSGTDPGRFNFRAFTPAIPAQERFDYYATANYKVFGDGLQLYGDVLYSHLTQDNGLAASPFVYASAEFDGLGIVQQSAFNPFPAGAPSTPNPTGAGGSLTQLRYRLVNDLGPRRSFFDKDAWRYVAAVKGDFNFKDNNFISHFGYDSGFVYERFNEIETDSGDAVRTLLTNEIAAGNFNPFIGQGAPVAGIAPIYDGNGNQIGTAPYDNASAAARSSYIGTTQFLERSFLVDAKVNVHLFPGLWNGGIDLAAGYEHRQDRLETTPDNVQLAGDQLGFNAATLARTTQEVDSFFGELSIPFVTSTMNIPGIYSFELGLAWRHEEFTDTDNLTKRSSSFDNSNPEEDFGGSPRVALRYSPIADLTLRATASQSFAAPLPSQLFASVGENFPQLFDSLVDGTFQPTVFQGGNVTLLPEKTDELTAGVVYSPKYLPGLTLTADYYNLFTTDLILDPTSFAQLALTQNANSGGTAFVDPDGPGGGAGFLGFPGGPGTGVTRDAQGHVLGIDSLNANAGRRNVQGLDITGVYQIPTQSLGTFTLSAGLNHFFTYKIEAVNGGGYTNFLGNYNNGSLPLAPGAIPFNKAYLRGEWEFKGFDFVATGNYIGDYEDDPSFINNAGPVFQDLVPGNPGTDANPNFILHRRVTSYITLDMQLSYTFPKPAPVEAAPAPGYSKDAKDGKAMAEHTSMSTADTSASIWQRLLWDTTLSVGVNNAFDRQPPTVLGAFNDNYDTSLYSIRNRYYYISLKKKF
ncbi:MAG TPA: TonB-dependent receptor [Verrucomicrobiae bacterium]|nr:TonB-dependent receptor [Verrucomicrobiae bacterium]